MKLRAIISLIGITIALTEGTFLKPAHRCRCSKFCSKWEVPSGGCGWKKVICCHSPPTYNAVGAGKGALGKVVLKHGGKGYGKGVGTGYAMMSPKVGKMGKIGSVGLGKGAKSYIAPKISYKTAPYKSYAMPPAVLGHSGFGYGLKPSYGAPMGGLKYGGSKRFSPVGYSMPGFGSKGFGSHGYGSLGYGSLGYGSHGYGLKGHGSYGGYGFKSYAPVMPHALYSKGFYGGKGSKYGLGHEMTMLPYGGSSLYGGKGLYKHGLGGLHNYGYPAVHGKGVMYDFNFGFDPLSMKYSKGAMLPAKSYGGKSYGMPYMKSYSHYPVKKIIM